jgi:hypothetical protein
VSRTRHSITLPAYNTERPKLISTVPSVLKAAEEPVRNAIETISQIKATASKQPYYKFNQMWTRQMQDAVRSSSQVKRDAPTHSIAGLWHPSLGLARRKGLRWPGRGQVRTAFED